MGIGAKDHIDRMLVKKYAKEKVDNTEDAQIMAISAEKYWKTAQELAQVQRVMIKVSSYLRKKKQEAHKKNLKRATNSA